MIHGTISTDGVDERKTSRLGLCVVFHVYLSLPRKGCVPLRTCTHQNQKNHDIWTKLEKGPHSKPKIHHRWSWGVTVRIHVIYRAEQPPCHNCFPSTEFHRKFGLDLFIFRSGGIKNLKILRKILVTEPSTSPFSFKEDKPIRISWTFWIHA